LALLFDLHWGLQRILKHARKIARLRSSMRPPLMTALPPVNGRLNDRRGLNYAIENDREAMIHISFGNLTESFGAFSVEPECNFPSFLTVSGSRLRKWLPPRSAFFLTSKRSSIGFPPSTCCL